MEAKGGQRTPWAWTVATFIGVGNLRPGPGTYGSVAAMLLWMAAAHSLHLGVVALGVATAVAVVLTTAAGIPAATIVAQEAGREDPGFVVIDEVAGQLIALLALAPSWKHALLALVLFRLFDIWKPWPIRRLEQLHGGTGIMLDDLAAGGFALVCAQMLTHFVRALA